MEGKGLLSSVPPRSLFGSCEMGKGVGGDVSGGSVLNHLLRFSSQCQPDSASAFLGS